MDWHLILLCGGILFVVWGYSHFRKFRRLRNGPRTTSVVVGNEERLGRSGKGYAAVLLYPVVEYHADGAAHRVRSIVGSKVCQYSAGDEVIIVYDPRNPESMMLENDLRRYAGSSQVVAVILIIAGAIAAVIGTLGIFLV